MKASKRSAKFSLESRIFDYLDSSDNSADNCSEDKIEFITEGTISDDGETVSLTYIENEFSGMENSKTTLQYRKSTPYIVDMIRKGKYGAVSMHFDNTVKRSHCSYNTGPIPLEFFLVTRKVENNIGGSEKTLLLDYIIEIHGSAAQRTVLRLKVD